MTTSARSIQRSIALSIASVLALVACGGDDASDTVSTEAPVATDEPTATDAPATSDIEITGAWARNSPMMATLGAAYMAIRSTNGDRLLAASVDSAVAAAAEVHEVVLADGADTSMNMGSGDTGSGDTGSGDMGSGEMVMREVEAIEIPAGETVMMMPGGYHVMLIDLVAPLEIGQTFDVVLTFETAGEVTVSMEVRDEAP